MSALDRKRKGSKAPHRGSATLTGSSKKASGKAQRYDASAPPSKEDLLTMSSPALHLTPFLPPGPVLNIEHGSELDKQTSKLFGLPLGSGTNFGLRILPGSDSHVPLVAKDTIDWLAHYGTSIIATPDEEHPILVAMKFGLHPSLQQTLSLTNLSSFCSTRRTGHNYRTFNRGSRQRTPGTAYQKIE